METASIASAEWLKDESLQRLLGVLSAEGEESRIAGGAVRDALLGRPVADVDIATTTLPAQTIRRAEAAGFRTVPTGIAHGTVTVIVGGRAYEVTTLRADIETDGRHAKVVFGRDWTRDAERRDFTINALYATSDGTVIDLVGGRGDLEARKVRFIGQPEHRIREDFLRILRFFRFFAWYGTGRPDSPGLKACSREREGLSRLSAERIWSELKKLLSAPDPSRALLWMRQAGVLTAILPETEKWGIDSIHGLTKAEAELGWPPDPLLRLAAILPPDAKRLESLAERLKLSKAEALRLTNWAKTEPVVPSLPEGEFAKLLYRGELSGIRDRLRLAQAGAGVFGDITLIISSGYGRLLAFLEQWERPVFPLKGGDLAALGISEGPDMGVLLRDLESWWVDQGFAPDGGALLRRAKTLGN